MRSPGGFARCGARRINSTADVGSAPSCPLGSCIPGNSGQAVNIRYLSSDGGGADLCNSNAPDFKSGGTWFESLSDYLLYCQETYVVVSSRSLCLFPHSSLLTITFPIHSTQLKPDQTTRKFDLSVVYLRTSK